MAPAKKTGDTKTTETEAKGGGNVADNVMQGYVQEAEGLEHRLRALGDGDDNAGLKSNLNRRLDEISEAAGGAKALAEGRRRFGRVDESGKPIERRPDGDDVETR